MVLSKDVKIAICFGLICGAIISIFNMCFADSEDVDLSVANNTYISTSNDTIIYVDGLVLQYFNIEPGYKYSIIIGNSARRVGYCDSLSYGTQCYDVQVLSNTEFSFNASDVGYMFFVAGPSLDGVTVTREALPGMSNFIDNIAYSLSIADLSDVWVLVVPLIAISVLFGLGFYFIKRILNKFKKAKGGI